AKVPLKLAVAQADAHHQLYTKLTALRAKLNPEEWLKLNEKTANTHEKTANTQAENQAISEALKGVDTSKPVDEQRKQFITDFTKSNPNASVKDTVELAKTIISEKPKKEPKVEEVGVGGDKVQKMQWNEDTKK